MVYIDGVKYACEVSNLLIAVVVAFELTNYYRDVSEATESLGARILIYP